MLNPGLIARIGWHAARFLALGAMLTGCTAAAAAPPTEAAVPTRAPTATVRGATTPPVATSSP
ncbi:MAG: hypothetical protein ACRDIY_18785, partial [Chloroflexota bacterium]